LSANAKSPIVSTVLQANPITWIHSLSAGVDQYINCPELQAENSKITLSNAKGSFSQFLAEYSLFGILWHGKRATHWRSLQKKSLWEKGPVKYCGIQTLGIVGYGDIGYHTAKAVKAALGMRIIALKRDVSKIETEKRACVDELVDFSGFEYLCRESDYIISILPNTPGTKDFFTAKAFGNMKKNCCFMNFGRGESVVEED
jgi:phosphoglycerate dehydrogenase-like enzyme